MFCAVQKTYLRILSQNCVTGVVERSLSRLQILKGIHNKNTAVPKYFFDAS